MTKDKLIKIIKQIQQDPKFAEIFSSNWEQPIKSKPTKHSKSKEKSKCKV